MGEIPLYKNFRATKMAKWALMWIILSSKFYKMLPNKFLQMVFSQLAPCQSPPEPFREHEPMRLWMPDRPQR